MSALFLVVLPVAMYGLEVILNFVQALIFSVLTLIFTLLAIESHDEEEGELVDEGMEALHVRMRGPRPRLPTEPRSTGRPHGPINPAAGRA